MTFNDMVLSLDKDNKEFNHIFNQCLIFAESSKLEYETNLKEAELTVIKESGSSDDLVILEKEASDGFVVKSIKTIKKMISSFITWITNIAKSITDFFTSKKTKDALNKANTVLKENPKKKNEKIEVADIKNMEKVCDRHQHMVDARLAKFNAKKFSSTDEKDLDNIEESYEKEKGKVSKAKLSITLVAAIALIGGIVNSMTKNKQTATEMKEPKIDETSTPEDIASVLHATSLKINILKDKSNVLQSGARSIFLKITNAITHSGPVDVEDIGTGKHKNDYKKESATSVYLDENDYLNNIFEEINEYANKDDFNPNEYLTMLESTLEKGDCDAITESFDNPDTLENYLTVLEKDIEEDWSRNNANAYLESMEADLFDEDDDIFNESVDEKVDRLSEIFSELENQFE